MFRCFSSRLFFFFRFLKKPSVVYSVPSAMLCRQCNRIEMKESYMNNIVTWTQFEQSKWTKTYMIAKWRIEIVQDYKENKNNTREKCVLTCPESIFLNFSAAARKLSKMTNWNFGTVNYKKFDQTNFALIRRTALSNHMIYSIRFYSLNAFQNINCR